MVPRHGQSSKVVDERRLRRVNAQAKVMINDDARPNGVEWPGGRLLFGPEVARLATAGRTIPSVFRLPLAGRAVRRQFDRGGSSLRGERRGFCAGALETALPSSALLGLIRRGGPV